MSEFLFLFPIQPYLDGVIGERGERWTHSDLLAPRLNVLIDKRYRQNGYGVNWVFFSEESDPSSPDWSLKAPEFNIEAEDRILTAGVPLSLFLENKTYPEPEHILGQLPEHSSLRVGGFHQWDCVSKVAKAAYGKGADVLVDEDTTELFFLQGSRSCYIPMVRDVKYLLMDQTDPLYEMAKMGRAERPWFAQIVP